MADETKPEQKPVSLEPPKDIEDLLKELPKIDVPKPVAPKPIQPSNIISLPPKPLTPPPPAPRSTGQSGTLSVPPKPAITPAPLPTADLTPKPNSAPLPKPVQQSPTAAPAPSKEPDKFKSLIRTMEGDLEAVKKGKKPESKPFEIKPPPLAGAEPKIIPPPPLKMPLPQAPQIKLGPAEKSKTFEMPRAPRPLPPPATPSQKTKSFLNPKILILILAITAVLGGAWLFLTRQSKKVILFTPTPTPIQTPAVAPEFFEIFEDVYPITISSTENFIASFNNSIKNVSPLINGKATALSIRDENGKIYLLSEIAQKLQINIPNDLINSLESDTIYLFAYGQQETFGQNGLLSFNQTPEVKIVLAAKSNNPSLSRSSLNGWEITMSNDLKNLFSANFQKATSQTFLDNIYAGTDVRYRNFPYADDSIDYAIVNLPKYNADYFVLTNSRESIYSWIDLLQAL